MAGSGASNEASSPPNTSGNSRASCVRVVDVFERRQAAAFGTISLSVAVVYSSARRCSAIVRPATITLISSR
jgi:hypothetical protein